MRYDTGQRDRSVHVMDEQRQTAQQARELVSRGEHVVLDATWSDPEHRATVRELAGETMSELHELKCVLPSTEAEARIRHRLESGGDVSEATPNLASEFAERFAPWPEATDLLTHAQPDEVLEQAVRTMGLEV